MWFLFVLLIFSVAIIKALTGSSKDHFDGVDYDMVKNDGVADFRHDLFADEEWKFYSNNQDILTTPTDCS